MDPITALSLACNVLQLVEQAIEAAIFCKDLYERGSLDENNKIEEYTGCLTAANNDIETALKKHAATPATRTTKLQKISNEAQTTAAALKLELNKLKLSKRQGIKHAGSAFTMALRTIAKKGTIERLRQQLEAQEAALQSGLVKELYIKAGQDNLTRRKEFRYLSKGQKNLVAQVLSRLQLASDDIIKAIEASETALSAHLDNQDLQLERSFQMLSVNLPSTIKKSESNIVKHLAAQDLVLKDATQESHAQSMLLQEQKRDTLRLRLLDALAFPEMNERRNMIEGRVADFGDTYLWIFYPPPRTDDYQQHEFVNWLRNEKDIFWISGKPGSGKSSLMEYICQNLQAGRVGSHHLAAWAGGYPVRLLSFWFFRPATTPLLKSMEGFWRSLCHQILDADDNLLGKIQSDNDNSVPASLRSCLTSSGSRARSWTVTELQSWFSYLVTHSDYNYFILVDGLDEVADEIREALLNCICYIASRSKRIKVCCSSRPEHPFQDVLRQYPSIKLQDFNIGDIELHCHKHLSATRAEQYASDICSRAEGVFLWAYLVTEDLRSAASQGDSKEDLECRLEECPTEMNKLFTFMLERQDKFYAKYPKPYLPLVLASQKAAQDPTLLELFLASQDETKSTFGFPKEIDTSHLAYWDGLAMGLEANVVARCTNLIECYVLEDRMDISDFPDSFPHQQLSKANGTAVRFIHRSARDFLVESEGGAAFLRSCHISEQDAFRRLTLASATTFLVNSGQVGFGRPLQYASYIRPDCWRSLETTTVDAIFAEAQARDPLKMPSLVPGASCEEQFFHHDYFEPLCLGLSPLDNLTCNYTAFYSMGAYIEAKLASIDPDTATLVAGFCAVSATLSRSQTFYATQHEFISKLEQYLSWTQDLTLMYNLCDSECSHFSVTGPLWQHVRLAITHLYFSEDGKKPARALAAFLHHLSCKEVQASYVKGWLIYADMDETGYLAICLVPDEAARFAQNFHACDIFEIHVPIQDPVEWRLNALTFYHYSPAGLERFFEIGPTVGEALQKLVRDADETYEHHSMQHAIGDFGESIATLLNQHLDELTPLEIARILFLHREYPGLFFRKGKFCGEDDVDDTGFESISEEERHGHIPQIHPEDDYELCKFIQRLHSKWDKQQEPESILDYRLELSDSDEETGYDDDWITEDDEVGTDEDNGEDMDEEDHTLCGKTGEDGGDDRAGRDTVPLTQP